MRGARTGIKRLGVASAMVLLPLALLAYAGCVDGVTPNCSDPAVQCGPDLDGAADRIEAARLPEAAAKDAAPDATDAGEDARDADLDARDGG